jgi:hypothetical protein
VEDERVKSALGIKEEAYVKVNANRREIDVNELNNNRLNKEGFRVSRYQNPKRLILFSTLATS